MLKFRKIAVTVFLSLAIFVIFGEFGLRLFKKQLRIFYPAGRTFPPIYARSGSTTIALRANADVRHYNYYDEFVKDYHINSAGLRGYTQDGDIVMLGDSFLFGIGLGDGETVPYCLQKMSGVNVINAGVPGYSLDDEYVVLKGYDARKIAVAGFFLGNDLDDLAGHDWILGDDGLPSQVIHKDAYVDDLGHLTGKESPRVSRIAGFLRNNSFFYTVLSENRYKLGWKAGALANRLKKSGRKEEAAAPVPAGFKEDEASAKCKRLFLAMKARNNRLLVLVIPSRAPEAAETGFKKYIIDFFDREKIDYLCVPSAPDSLYYSKDCHWTPEGARVAASLVYEKLKALCWL